MIIIKHKNKEIIVADYVNLKRDDLLKSIKETTEYIINQNKKCLLLINFENADFSGEVIDYLLDSANIKKSNKLVEKFVICKTKGYQKMISQVLKKNTAENCSDDFDDIELAKDYLVG